MSESLAGTIASSRTISLDIDPDTASQHRKYPSVRDYYQASVVDSSKPIQLQHGLSNYSGLVLGDDRIAFSESILSATYRVAIEDKLTIDSPSKSKSKVQRRREYQEAHEKVGDIEINRLEKVMKDKLIQRSYITSSPFQVRKAFKFFDQEQKMRIHIEGFTRALEFLGFQFSEMQNLALFAKFDPDFTGEIDYMNFIKTAMFYAPNYTGQDNIRALPKPLTPAHDDLYEVPDLEDQELRALQQRELQKIFNKVDVSRRGSLSRDQFELLLMAIGHNVSFKQIESYWQDLGIPPSGSLSFDLFFDWWTSDVGAQFVPVGASQTATAARSAADRTSPKPRGGK